MSVQPSASFAKTRYQELLRECPSVTWRHFADGTHLSAHLVFPENHDPKRDRAPAILFFHGGFWKNGQIGEFAPWAYHLAKYGIVSILIEYRQAQEYDVTASMIIEDSQEAWMWLVDNAENLGIDARRIISAGSEAGGLLALLLAMGSEHTNKGVTPRYPMPDLVILFRPIVETEEKYGMLNSFFPESKERKSINPSRLIRKKLPPLFLSAGGKDRFVPSSTVQKFAKTYGKKNSVDFLLLEECDQSFYYFNINPTAFELTLRRLLLFLAEHDIIESPSEADLETIVS